MKKGVAASPGIGIGKVYRLDEPEIIIDKNKISSDDIENEIMKLKNAVNKSNKQLQDIYVGALKSLGKEETEIIQAHLMIVEDLVFLETVKNKIRDERIKVELALQNTVEEQVCIFEAIEDPYLRERVADIKDVGGRILKNILNIAFKDVSQLEEDVILVGVDITPSIMAVVDRQHVKGIVAEIGGKTSHTAILARNMDIPAVLGVKDILTALKEGQVIAVDGTNGIVEIELDQYKEMRLKQKLEKQVLIKNELRKLRDITTQTKDGIRVELAANIGKPEDTRVAMENGAEGVGLFRTEFLYMDRKTMPNEEEQFESYKQAVEGMEGRPIIIRTLDIGGDKEIPYFKLPKEENPFLGWRAIRICLEEVDLFKNQLRAILRASAFGKIRIMYPMIASVEEVIKANKILEEAKSELRIRSQDFDEGIEVGIMVEIPSAAITADLIIKEVDFFSIGTNDLTQYVLAVDRTNEKVSSIYNSFHPGVLRLIQRVIEVSHKEGKFTGMCGELAGNPVATILLLGMGLDEFSMSPSSILKIKKIINTVDVSFARKVAEEAMKFTDANQIEEYLKKILKDIELGYIIEV